MVSASAPRTACAARAWLATLTIALLGLGGAARAAETTLAERGEYVFHAASCAGCHTDVENDGAPLAGGRRLPTPFGTFVSPNITPDPTHGIGAWSEADLERALRHGEGPGWFDHYYPVFPYPSYTRMSGEDVRALWAYLRTVEPVARENEPHEIPWYLRIRVAAWGWKLLFFEPGEFTPDPARSGEWNRGAYLVRALSHCGECHTPRDGFGVSIGSRELAGSADGAEGKATPNITPHEADGVGRWSKRELREYLHVGMDPDGDFAGGLMAEVVDESLAHLRIEDIDAIVEYLVSLPPLPSD
ncbi:MAG: cytochrome c [Ectothiorhodospiraceae bacterium]|nr:cytochrome c [Chromatiales bacterium]MCP5153824.1 cytochrome c [Ectothiorhodospiraceae bacterium]